MSLTVAAWAPLVDGERARRVDRQLRRLETQLLQLPAALPDEKQPIAIGRGLPGYALAHGYLVECERGEAHAERCQRLLEIGLASLDQNHGEGSLWTGLAGIGFLLESLGVNADDDLGAVYDRYLRDELSRTDLALCLYHGLAGRAVYARERAHRPDGRALYDAIAARLVSAGERDADGMAWRKAADLRFADAERCRQHPNGWIDLSIIRGMPGVVAVLAAHDADASRAAARDGMKWLWSRRQLGAGQFPINDGEPAYDGSGWCYGDEGMAGVMLPAALALGDSTWIGRWLEVLERASARTLRPDRALGLCHGAAMMAHIYHRAFRVSGAATMRDAALRWIDALEDALEAQPPEPTSFLHGSAGIAVLLASLLSDVEPEWDKVFLLAPPAGEA